MSAKNEAAAAPDVEDDASSGTDSDDIDECMDLTKVRGAAGGDDDDGDEEGNDSDSSESDGDRVINIEFEFFDPRPIDFKSVRRLLERYLPGEEDSFNVSGMADAIIAQGSLGTMVKVEDDPDVYAFSTLLCIHKHRTTDWMKQIRSFLIRKAPAGKAKAELTRLFDDEAAGAALLLNERVMNLPPEMAPRIQSNLLEDLEWAAAHAPEEGDRMAFGGIRHFIVVAPCFTERAARAPKVGAGSRTSGGSGSVRRGGGVSAGAAAATASGAGGSDAPAADDADAEDGAGAGAAAPMQQQQPQHFYYHFEEELYAEQADLTFTFPVEAADSGGSSAAAAASSSASAASSSAAGSGADVPSTASSSLRLAQFRRVIVMGREALGAGVAAMDDLLLRAQDAAAAAAEGGASAAAASSAAGAGGAEGAAAAPPAKRPRTGSSS